MVEATTPAEIERLEELLGRSCGVGEWRIVRYGDGDSLEIHHDDDWRVCFMATPGESSRAMDQIDVHAALIVALVNAAPSLLAAIREQHEALSARPAGPYDRDYSHLPLVDRLRMWIQPPHKPYPTHPRNPDGEEAATTIAAQSAEIERLRDLLREGVSWMATGERANWNTKVRTTLKETRP